MQGAGEEEQEKGQEWWERWAERPRSGEHSLGFHRKGQLQGGQGPWASFASQAVTTCEAKPSRPRISPERFG